MRKNSILKPLCAIFLSAALLTSCSGGEEATAADSAETGGTAELASGPETTVEEAAAAGSTEEEEFDDYELQIGSLKGPTTIGLLHLIEKSEAGNAVGNYRFTMETDPAALSAAIISGDLDVALVPANLAAVLYNRTNAGVAAVEINTLGVLDCVSADESIAHITDLKGKTVLTTGQGATPEYALRFLLDQYDVTDCKLEFHSEATEIAALLKENPDQIAVLPQPFATSAVMQNDALDIRFSLTDEWDALENGTTLITGVTVVRREILEEHPTVVAMFLDEHAFSVRDANNNIDRTVELIVKHDIIASKEVAAKALPHCGVAWITGTDMETALKGYLQVLYDADHTSIGGTFPTNDFYFDILGK
ncbi:MAG: ABC transporter substrate-binding protein [Lachnospiraceae bacterium]|nr:ABC transporter substrate-binding protein [Lachnospiraceae bacterium]